MNTSAPITVVSAAFAVVVLLASCAQNDPAPTVQPATTAVNPTAPAETQSPVGPERITFILGTTAARTVGGSKGLVIADVGPKTDYTLVDASGKFTNVLPDKDIDSLGLTEDGSVVAIVEQHSSGLTKSPALVMVDPNGEERWSKPLNQLGMPASPRTPDFEVTKSFILLKIDGETYGECYYQIFTRRDGATVRAEKNSCDYYSYSDLTSDTVGLADNSYVDLRTGRKILQAPPTKPFFTREDSTATFHDGSKSWTVSAERVNFVDASPTTVLATGVDDDLVLLDRTDGTVINTLAMVDIRSVGCRGLPTESGVVGLVGSRAALVECEPEGAVLVQLT